MKIIPLSYKDAGLRAPNIFIPLFEKESLAKKEIFSYLPASVKTAVLKLAQEEFKAQEGETKSVWFPQGAIKRVRLFGLGEKLKWNHRKEKLLPRNLVRYSKGERVAEFATTLSSLSNSKKDAALHFAANALLANFEFNKYKEIPKQGWPEIKTVYFAVDKKDLPEVIHGVREGMIIGEETNRCRHLANTPGGDMTPEKLAAAAKTAIKNTGVKIRVLEEKDLKRLGMGGILGVAKGSSQKPKFIILEYQRGPANQKPLVLVGKGVTFDAGGLNLKSSVSIYEMHMDMSGGAAVIHGIAAIAKLRLPINVIGLIPSVENMISGKSYRPGDILKTITGKTIEVLNTDAEGRIILADALGYGARLNPGLMVDFATLTGAAMVALGRQASALFTNKPEIQEKLMQIGNSSGDYVWPLPLWDEYFEDIKGTFADVANIGKEERIGDAINGAKFLEQFAGKTTWAHIDIVPRMTAAENEYLTKGASGVGVRYIVELAKEYTSFLVF